jgi:hypothetical protein
MNQPKGVVFLITSLIGSSGYETSLTEGGYAVANLVGTDGWKENRIGVLRSALEAHKEITPKAAVMELNFVGMSTPIKQDLPQILSLLGEQNASLALLTDPQMKPFERQVKGMWEGHPVRTADILNPNLNLRAEIDALLERASLGEAEKGF